MRGLHRGSVALGVTVALAAPHAALATTTSQSFTTAGEHAFVVPPAVTSLQLMLVGGNGGTAAHGTLGGVGATEIATLAVTPGETLYAEVGGDGGAADLTGQGLGGFNGGGYGAETIAFIVGLPDGGGGGGASDVRTIPGCPTANPGCPTLTFSLASRLVVAGGGGGGGGTVNAANLAAGGYGGAADAAGGDGAFDGYGGDNNGTGGARGTTTNGGGAGSPGMSTAGTLGVGGDGATSYEGGAGGGGGGGIYGGGGGGGGLSHQVTSTDPYYGSGGGGGGGGASSIPPGQPGVSNLSLIPTATGAEPEVVFTWVDPPPTTHTGPAIAVRPRGATLTGWVNPNGSQLSACGFAVVPAPAAGSSISCAQQLGSGNAPVAVTATLAGLAPSKRYMVQLTAASAQGQSSGPLVTFTTWPLAPAISKLKVARLIHRGKVRHPRHVSCSLRLSQPSMLTITFARITGRRTTPVAFTLKLLAHQGTNKLAFSSGRLAPGRYRVTVSATNIYGETSAPHHAAFTIAR